MTAFVDVRLIDGLILPYVAGAESALADVDLDPAFAAAWQGLLAAFPGLSLQPLFDGLPIPVLVDLVDAARTSGEEPPDPFAWFTLPCDDSIVEALVPALQALPFIGLASRRPAVVVAGISYGTNTEFDFTLQIRPTPDGVDAIHAWQVPGGTGSGVPLADIESGWDLGHQELLVAKIRKASVFGSAEVDHGTAVAGILVASDNGVGIVGIVPDASLALVTTDRGGADNMAAAITIAARTVGVGGVVVVEQGAAFFAGVGAPDVLVEFDPAVQVATRLATLFGITVIEPAGNGGVDLDAVPALAHTRPGSTTFIDSRTIVVGAAELAVPALDTWHRTFSSFVSRVDCFAAGGLVRAPSSSAPDSYQDFSGTSSASAIIGGAAAAVQGMSIAATGQLLGPLDIRRLFRDPALGTAVADSATARIGSMPDLRKISQAQGFVRVLPGGAAATTGDAAVLVHLDEQDRLVRRHWTLLTGWGTPLPLPGPADGLHLTPGQPAVLSTVFDDPVSRLVHEAYLVGPAGLHHLMWDSSGEEGDITITAADFFTVAQGGSVGAARVLSDRVVVVAVNPAGRLTVLTGDPDDPATPKLSTPLVVDTVGGYRRSCAPTVVSRGDAVADVVLIEDGGSLRWFTGNVLATIGTGWSSGVSEPSGAEFEPAVRAALLVLDDGLLAAGVNTVGALLVSEINRAAQEIGAASAVDPSVTLAPSGPVALATAGPNVVVLGVDTDGQLRAATRPRGGGDFSTLAAVPSDVSLSPLGGVTAISLLDLGVMALVVGLDGSIRFAISADGVIWPPLLPVF